MGNYFRNNNNNNKTPMKRDAWKSNKKEQADGVWERKIAPVEVAGNLNPRLR